MFVIVLLFNIDCVIGYIKPGIKGKLTFNRAYAMEFEHEIHATETAAAMSENYGLNFVVLQKSK